MYVFAKNPVLGNTFLKIVDRKTKTETIATREGNIEGPF